MTSVAQLPHSDQLDLRLPPLQLELGGEVRDHRVRGFSAGPDMAPAILLVHALTGSARAGGNDGWWAPLIGPGRAFDTDRYRVLCFNNLGSCYGSSGPAELPTEAELTTLDIARSLWLAVDALGIDRIHLAAGGSLGGMALLAMAALQPGRIARLLPIAASADASAWIVGFNHVQRQLVFDDPERGLELARQIAMLTYRAEPGLEANQSRAAAPKRGSLGRYRIQGYLEHQGSKLRNRFDPHSYIVLLDAMDNHDLVRGTAKLADARSSALVVDVDTDALFTKTQVERVAALLREGGNHVERATIISAHGHDAFLIEWDQLVTLCQQALALPVPRCIDCL